MESARKTRRSAGSEIPGDPIEVVVPTHARAAALARCLAALRRQTVLVEPIVVPDSGGRGPAWARNRGVERASGKVILFCDDDCEPDPHWAERLAAGCPADGAAAGFTASLPSTSRVAHASQLLTNELQRRSLGADGTLGFAPTCNLAVSSELIKRIPFDDGFPLAAGEDREWCTRAAAAGGAPVFVPDAIVRHRPALEGLGDLWRQQVRYGRGAASLRARGVPLAGTATRIDLLRRGFSEGPRTGALLAVAQAGVAVGYGFERSRRGPFRRQ